MHPSNTLFDGWQVINVVGLAKLGIDLFARWPWLPLTLVLDERHTVSSMLVPDMDKNWLTLTCDENILFFMHSDTILSKNGDGVVISEMTYTYERIGEVIE